MTALESTAWLGLALLAVSAVLVLWWAIGRRTGRPSCRRCRYDMRGAPSLSCPECGFVAKSQAELLWRRRPRVLLRLALAALVGGLVFRSVEPYVRDGWAGPIPLLVLHAAAPMFDRDGEKLVTRSNPVWSVWVTIDPELERLFAQTPGPTLAPSPRPSRWHRVLFARQCVLAAERLSAAADGADVNTDLERVRFITQLLPENERGALAGPIGTLVESSRDDVRAYGLEHLQRVGARTDDHLDRIAELARTSPAPLVRTKAYETAAIVSRSGTRTVEILRTGLSDESSLVRQACAVCLQGVAKWGEPALEDLDKLAANDWDSWVRECAAKAAEMIRRER